MEFPNEPAKWAFKRASVADQAAATLREAIKSGELGDPLPGEHQLSRRLGISRPTLRAALAGLATEGLVVVRKGHRSRVAKRLAVSSAPTRHGICIIGPVSPETSFSIENPLLLEMHAQLASLGVRWEQVFDARLGARNPGPRLEELVSSRPQTCWILFGAPEPIQRWFATSGLRALVLGSCAAGLKLPSVDFDYAAIGWHAAGAILRHGHTKVALVPPQKLLPGDVASLEAFRRYVEQKGANVTVCECSGAESTTRFRVKLAQLLNHVDRPTAWLSLRPALTVTLITQVLGCGLRIPQDISIVTRDTHALIESGLPELTRYRNPASILGTRAVRIALTLLAGRRVPLRPSLLMPKFVPGSSLAARAARRAK